MVVLGAVMALTLATVDEPPTRAQLHDPQAAADLVAGLRAGERRSYVALYQESRTRADGARNPPTTVTVAHSPKVELTRSGDTLRVETANEAYDCEIVEDKPTCFLVAGSLGLPLSTVLDTAIEAAPYNVLERGNPLIAGERARCFTVTAAALNRILPDLGQRAEFCLAADGIPLRIEYQRIGTESRQALEVKRAFDDAALAPLLDGYERVIPKVPQ